jgi:acyl-[acyl carrier protein]--UDP-N-acetylglucosamine O-acyltransferase
MSINKLFTRHPASVGETYFEHLANATRFAGRMMVGGAACLVHAVLPFTFVKTASHTIEELNERMVLHRSKLPASGASASSTR